MLTVGLPALVGVVVTALRVMQLPAASLPLLSRTHRRHQLYPACLRAYRHVTAQIISAPSCVLLSSFVSHSGFISELQYLQLLSPSRRWAWLALDLVRAAVGTDYARVVRAVYILAQVRLVATHGWTNPSDSEELNTQVGIAG